MTTDKICTTHLERQAYVYVRQSSPVQVRENQESTARQYSLKQRAQDMGWDPADVHVIDEDLGESGTSTEGRSGFQRLAEEVAQGHVGAIFALEVSRLARSCSDWHRLLELCGLADVVIVDEQAVYDPSDYNDKLLLGLKGQFSEAEVYWMRLRTRGAALAKARRGQLRFHPPTGYIWKEDEGFDLDPDEEVRRAIQLVFERFSLEPSARAVTRYFHRNELTFPSRKLDGSVQWGQARYRRILDILKNPIYAGTYVYGRRQERKALVNGEVRKRRTVTQPIELWLVSLHDAHPGYITWEAYITNQDKLRGNRTNPGKPEQRGAPRDGSALLQGLVLCGRCGRRMRVQYSGNRRWPYYVCDVNVWQEEEQANCWSVSATDIDCAIEKLFLETVRPAEIELSLAVAREVEKQSGEVDRQWKMRLERARYEAKQAERRYMAVEPENRLVARTLEKNWNDKLRQLCELETAFEDVRRQERLELTNRDREEILALARDLPKVWRAKSTSNAERKNLLRMLIEEVALAPIDVPSRQTRVKVMWKTGEVTELDVPRAGRGEPIATSNEAASRIGELVSEGQTDAQIALALNGAGLTTGTGRAWTESAVGHVRRRRGFQKPRAKTRPWQRLPERREDGKYSVRGVAAELDVPPYRVYYWHKTGRLSGVREAPGNSLWFDLDDQTVQQLRALKNP